MSTYTQLQLFRPPRARRRGNRFNVGECVHCGVWRQSLHRDHITPKFLGGSDDESNIQLLCANCHEDKSRVERRGFGHPQMAAAKIAAAREGKPLSVQQRYALSLAFSTPTGREQARQNGRKHTSHTDDARRRISEGLKRAWAEGRR